MSRSRFVVFALGCLLAAGNTRAQWSPDMLGNIFYPANVGVGNAAPRQRVSVLGNLEVADAAPGAAELALNGVDWTGSGGLATNWQTWYWNAFGGSITFATSTVTGNGFTGNAQRVVYQTVTGVTGGKLYQPITFLKDHQYKISFRYRSSTTLQVVLGDNEAGAMLYPNQGNAITVTLLASPVIQNRPTLDFYLPGGGGTPVSGSWFEIDDVSVKETTAGNVMVRGLVTGGGVNGIKVDLAGNVGLGGDPFHKLDVAGNMTVGAGYRSVTTVPVDGMIVQGNVGIGTSNPATPLDVNGAATLRSTLAVTGSASFANGVNVSGPFNASGAALSGPMTLSVPSSTGTMFNMTANGGASTVLLLSPTVLASYANFDLRDGGGTSRIYLPAYVGNAYFKNIGNVGIGVTNPASLLSNTATNILDSTGTGINPGAISWRTNQQGYGLAVRNDNTSFTLASGMLVSTAATDVTSYVLSVDSGVTPVSRFAVRADGQVRIGGEPAGTQPGDKLVVNGAIRATSVIGAVYQDLAEWVPATEAMPPGTVVVVDDHSRNTVRPSSEPYDTRVAGVVSAQPGLLLGIEAPSKEMIATTGRVKVRVDSSGGSIRQGDLLVTSARPGVAMRSQPLDLAGVKIHRPGTLIGKALESLASGEGEILVLLSLQ